MFNQVQFQFGALFGFAAAVLINQVVTGHVHGLELIVSAPPEVGIAQLREFVSEKRFWIYTKLAEKDRLQRQVPRKEFVGGEGFLYLGRSHRMKWVDDQDTPLKLVNGRFALRHDAQKGAREHFIRWYSEKARVWLSGRVADYQSRMEVAPAGVKVQDLGYRWGSCGKGDWLYFHWKTILLPARIAEYVVVHEIAHLHEPHHTLRSGCALSAQCPTMRSAGHGWPNTEWTLRGYKKTWRIISPVTTSNC